VWGGGVPLPTGSGVWGGIKPCHFLIFHLNDVIWCVLSGIFVKRCLLAIVVHKIQEILKMRRVNGRWSPKCGSLPRDAGRIPRAFFARSPGGSIVMFRYYLLGGDTAAPSGLNARLCHAFLVDYLSQGISASDPLLIILDILLPVTSGVFGVLKWS